MRLSTHHHQRLLPAAAVATLALCGGGHFAAAEKYAGAQKPILGGGARVEDGGGKGPLTEEFGTFVEGLLAEWHVPGLAIGVVDGNDTWTEGYGIATYPSTPVTPKTLFYCASTSKAFTAATLAIMIASGNYTVPSLPGTSTPLDWTTPIAQIIPADFVLADPWATEHITLEDALSHRTGLPRHDKFNTHHFAPENRTATIQDTVRLLRYLPLSAPPRTRWQYCNQMYVVATHAIQTLAGGRWLGDVLRERIWAPLGMRATRFSLEDALAAAPEGLHLARGYGWRSPGGGGPEAAADESGFRAVPFMPTDEIGGAGAVMSNVEDYALWIRSLLREEGPVPKEGHRAIKTPRMFVDPATALPSSGAPYDFAMAYALGWLVNSYRGHRFWTHSGGMHAYGAEVFFFPDLDFGVVTLGNTAGTSNYVGLLAVWKLVDDKLGVPEEERHDWAAGYRSSEEDFDARIANAINKYYPSRPSTPVSPALPLTAYTGTYFHPAYMNFTLKSTADTEAQTYLSRDNASLVAVRRDATWPTVNEFEHVSGEYWMLFFQYMGNPTGPFREFAPVQFRVGADGRVEGMEVTWLSVGTGATEDIVEGVVWFDKIE